ncbi:MAG: biotin/lipoyl-containing protein [Bryobacteraceae bacterium]
MKLRVQANGSEYFLDVQKNGTGTSYVVSGAESAQGSASVERVMPGVYSILDGDRSYVARLVAAKNSIEVWVGRRRFSLAISDPRDRLCNGKTVSAHGPQEIRALMPGKIVKLLVGVGDEVNAGDGVIVVEAMKMQNEMKAAKAGRIARVHVAEGDTVAAGEALLVVE